MSFSEEFSALEQKSHNQMIATKIHTGLSGLRSQVDSSPTVPKRWVWELIQNAKDVNVGGKVAIRIDADLDGSDAYVTFSHNGGPFSVENIRFLIEQVSSKIRTKASTEQPLTTGRFGTGFLTTHLLSPYVLVTGVAKQQGLSPRRFALYLDRSGTELEQLIAAVEDAKASIKSLDDQPQYEGDLASEFNTTFRYSLADDTGKKVARAGLEDLSICLPYTLAFVAEIESVIYLNHRVSLQKPDKEPVDGKVRLLSVTTTTAEGENQTTTIAVMTDDLTTITMPIEQSANGVRILPLNDALPRLFCDFPLLGTETFPFPVIINNPTFNPTEARDGLLLTKTTRPDPLGEHNRAVIKQSTSLYVNLLKYASENGWRDIHLLAVAKPIPAGLSWVDQDWYQNEILKPIRDVLLRTDIVRTAANTMAPIQSADGTTDIWFPTGPTIEIRHGIWNCCQSLFPHRIPALCDVEHWQDILWPECRKLTLSKVSQFISSIGKMQKLTLSLSGVDPYAWLNEFYKILQLSENDFLSVVAKVPIFPNQNGTFKKKAELFLESGNLDPFLLDILKLLGTDLREQLLSREVSREVVAGLDGLLEKDESFVVKEISAAIEKCINEKATEKCRPAFDRLLRWFSEEKTRAKSLFPSLYHNKHRLYDDEEIVANIHRAEQLNEILKHYNVKTVDELRTTIERQTAGSTLLPVTQEVISSLGINSIEEWHKALEDKNLAALFSHESTPTTDMFVYAQTLIQRAKDRVIAHLRTIKEYDLTDLQETATTILAGVTHNGRDVQIVVRPAYDGTVIIYYQSEQDVLDYEDYELWVDTGMNVRRITFGHILKATEIRRFPI